MIPMNVTTMRSETRACARCGAYLTIVHARPPGDAAEGELPGEGPWAITSWRCDRCREFREQDGSVPVPAPGEGWDDVPF